MEETPDRAHGNAIHANDHSDTIDLTAEDRPFVHGEKTKKRCRVDNVELVGKLQRVRLLEEEECLGSFVHDPEGRVPSLESHEIVECENVHYVDMNRMLGEVHQEMVERRQRGE